MRIWRTAYAFLGPMRGGAAGFPHSSRARAEAPLCNYSLLQLSLISRDHENNRRISIQSLSIASACHNKSISSGQASTTQHASTLRASPIASYDDAGATLSRRTALYSA